MQSNMLKRAFDMIASGLGLLFLLPLLVLIAVVVKLTSRGPIFFQQERMGRNFQPFYILKFRSMVPDAPKQGPAITAGRDPRITWIGNLLRKTKLDELPQLLNVLKGEMSLVGPRPEVRKYVEMFREDYAEVLRVRPGITDIASITFRNESELLGQAADPEAEYVNVILPKKIELAKEYANRSSLLLDISLIFRTLLKIVM
jgi:lipopolysaccharide/colanic/teichoic acid biosynthesis glycosyltransferase